MTIIYVSPLTLYFTDGILHICILKNAITFFFFLTYKLPSKHKNNDIILVKIHKIIVVKSIIIKIEENKNRRKKKQKKVEEKLKNAGITYNNVTYIILRLY